MQTSVHAIHLYLRYLERYMDALTAPITSCGLGSAVAMPDSYAFLATAHATFAEMSLMSRRAGYIWPLALCSARGERALCQEAADCHKQDERCGCQTGSCRLVISSMSFVAARHNQQSGVARRQRVRCTPSVTHLASASAAATKPSSLRRLARETMHPSPMPGNRYAVSTQPAQRESS